MIERAEEGQEDSRILTLNSRNPCYPPFRTQCVVFFYSERNPSHSVGCDLGFPRARSIFDPSGQRGGFPFDLQRGLFLSPQMHPVFPSNWARTKCICASW